MKLWFRSPPWESLVYWALDLETGGLHARRDPILAVGMLPIREGRVRLAEAYRTLVRPAPGAHIDPRSIEAHQLVRADLEAAPAVGDVLPEIARRIEGAVLLVHHRSIDVAFLRAAFDRARLHWPKPAVVDTAVLLMRAAEEDRLRRPELPADFPTLQLGAARRRFGLPAYPEHEALSDALATAELFLVLTRRIGARTLRDLR
jgi:DNA polymerase-3 subunit epsilon